jgi:hypothetical protein
MNRIKSFGPEFEQLIADLSDYLIRQDRASLESDAEMTRLDLADPFSWLHDGKTSIQKGLMSLTRSIAQPTFF